MVFEPIILVYSLLSFGSDVGDCFSIIRAQAAIFSPLTKAKYVCAIRLSLLHLTHLSNKSMEADGHISYRISLC